MTYARKGLCLSLISSDAWKRGATLHLPASGAARPWICRGLDRHLLAVLPNSRAARDFAADASSLGELFNIPRTRILPEIAIAAYDDESGMLDAQKAERGEAMSSWAEAGGVLAASPGALMGAFSVGGDTLSVACGDELSRARLIDWLGAKGYERVDIVWSPGQFTYRGGIVDLFDPKDPYPIRIEFFDDDVDTMRYFATDTQRSVRVIKCAEIRALSSRRRATLESFYPADMMVVIFEPAEAENAAESYSWMRSGIEMLSEEDAGIEWLDVLKTFSLFPRLRVTAKFDGADIRSSISSLPSFKGRTRDLEAYCDDLAARSIEVSLISETERFRKWAAARGYRESTGAISGGFVDGEARVAVIGDLELSGLSLIASGERGLPADWGDRLLPGQWVVHEDYGVARYLGSEQIETPDGPQEYLVLEYADDRKLKIPVMHFRKISRYTPMPGEDPSADNLKAGRWKKMSERAKEQAEAAAKYLIEVYARRETTAGHAFAGDEVSEREFEETFPYTETRDQLVAIGDVIADMSRPTPMDRLLVGDVGFGKTEVALRATARCVFDGRQAAIMAPTTLLAQQHFETWKARFDQFGVRVEVLSRFVPAKRQREITEAAEDGRVDVIIGTHRLLGGDVKFKKLGLVIVDEEHRFGVMHKEHMKNIYPDVDVLMLSATPIPRSLHLSLSGLRDMSLLQTPPRARLPVITAVGPWSEEMVRGAVLREKARGGQVFYVHNRVQTIDREALAMRRLFPKLVISVAHGQMSERELKSVMDRFSAGDIDVLVCTTIVESGLDIPRANTLIVSDAQDLGLAQMHQLRGRVGRRDEQAYALFLHPAEIKLSREAIERMEAIASLGEFGAGYELAKRDLEIRGGGELVGTSQHGSLGRVGFQRYCDLLEEAIRKEKGEWRERTQVDVAIPSAIPEDLIPQQSVRVSLYRRLLWTFDVETLDSLIAETIDRFGAPPKVLKFLFDVARMKILGPSFGVESVAISKGMTAVKLTEDSPLAKKAHPRGWMSTAKGLVGPGGYEELGIFIKTMF